MVWETVVVSPEGKEFTGNYRVLAAEGKEVTGFAVHEKSYPLRDSTKKAQ
jgi:hypothetical protein